MISILYLVLAPSAGSTQSLRGSLSQLDLISAGRLAALVGAGWLRPGNLSSTFQPAIPNTPRGTAKLPKTFQYPEAPSGSVQ
jgi:hypothetical protein